MTNPVDQSENSREQRRLEYQAALAPFVGLAGTMYGIIRAFKSLDRASPISVIAPGMLETIIFTAVCIPILLLISLAWDWLSKK